MTAGRQESSEELRENIRQEVLKELKMAQPSEHTPNFAEIGTTGVRRYGGYVYEEFLPQLRWPRAGRIYQEMESNDPVIGSILYVCEQLIRRASWRVEAGGTTRVDEEAREFLESCMNDMSTTWVDTIAEILTMMPYGFAWHEEVYKRREGDVHDPTRKSKYDDGRIGWRRLPGRAQYTIEEWIFDDIDDGGVLAAIQTAPPNYDRRVIPLEKSLLFRTKTRYNNPEGRSLLRNAYRPWYFKKHIEEIEGIGIERDLAGLPVLKPPESVDIWNPHDELATRMRNEGENLVRNIRRDQNEGVLLPFGWDLSLLSTGSRRQFDTNAIINRYDQRIAITLLADIVMLGGDKVGSFALADVKSSLLSTALEAILDSIEEIFNRHAVPRLFKLNAFPGLTNYPKLVAGGIMAPSLTEIARYIQALSGAQMPLFPDDNLEEFLRNLAGMPERPNQHQEPKDEDEVNDEGGDGGEKSPGVDGRLMNQGVPQEVR
jgi:hypothetical protein